MGNQVEERAPRKRGSLGKKLLYAFAAVVVLLVIAYFVVTSGAFLKAVILPKVGKSLNAEIHVDSASLSPFSRVDLQKLSVKTVGPDPIITADEVRVRYGLMDILHGKIFVDEVTLVNPVVRYVKNADNTTNLDPLTRKSEKPGKETPKAKKEKAELRLKNITLQNGTIYYTEKSKDGSSKSAELHNVNISLDQIGNGISGNLKLASDVAYQQTEHGTNSVLQAKLAGSYAVTLDADLLPDVLKGETDLDVSRGDGSFKDVAGLRAGLGADVTPTEVRLLALKFSRGGQDLGQLRAQGPFDLNTREGHLRIELNSLDKNVLELATAGKGWGFGKSTLNSTNEIDLSQKANFIAASGRLVGRSISVSQNGQTTPELDLDADYRVDINLTDQSAVLQKLNLDGKYQNKPLLIASLDRQMNLSWGSKAQGFKEAALNLVVTNFNVADWRPLVPTNLASGVLNTQLKLIAQQDGKILTIDLASTVQNLGISAGTNHLDNTQLGLQLKGVLEQFAVANISSYTLQVSQANGPLLQANGTARYDTKSQNLAAQTTAELQLSKILAVYPIAGAQARAGTLKANATFSQAGGAQKSSGNVALENFDGGYDRYVFKGFQSTVDYNLELANGVADIRRISLNFAQNYNKGGSVDLTGKYDMAKKAGQFTFKTLDLNENTFRPVLAPSLDENQLVSITLNSTGEAKLDPAGENSIKAEFKVANWVVQDKAGTLPKTPLAASISVDGSMRQQLLDLRQLLVQLTPTDRAKNDLLLSGKLDLNKTNATPSTLTLSSSSFDVTPYYNMFGGSTNKAAPAKAAASSPQEAGAAAQAQSGEPKEPGPLNLPFQNLTANLKIDSFFLRDLAISNWTGTVAIQTNMVAIKPFKLALNGAPIDLSGNFNLGVTGFVYDVSFAADHVPLEPIISTFGSTNDAGRLKGNLVSQAALHGAGITGASLQKALQGNFFFSLTNMNYQVVAPKWQRLLVPIAFALRVPEITNTPINFVNARTEMGGGRVNLQELQVQSEAFLAGSRGPIELAPVLTNTPLNLPVELSLRRTLAERAKVLPPNTPADAKYARLPDFVSVKGTVGEPKTELNKIQLAKLGLETALNFGVGGKDLQKAVGALDILSNTNNSGTNGSTSGNLLKGLGSILGPKQQATNAPAADTNAPSSTTTNQPARKQKINPFDLLNRALPPK